MRALKKQFIFGYLLMLTCCFMLPLQAYTEGPVCQQALKLASQKKFSQSHQILNQKKCPLTSEVVTWLMLKNGPADISFHDYRNFIQSHEHWPWLDILKEKAEHHIDDRVSTSEILKWFAVNPPKTITGIGHYAKALRGKNLNHEVTEKIRHFWKEKDLSASDELLFLKKFKSYLKSLDIKAKAIQLLNKRRTEEATRLIKFASNADQKYIEARLALQKGTDSADSYLEKMNLKPDQEVYLARDYLTWLRKKENPNYIAFFQKISPFVHKYPEEFWKERYIMAHESLEAQNISKSYKIASAHGLIAGVDFVEAEWFCGWLALRFMNNPQKALDHFSKLQSVVKTPISRARVYYWMGRAYEDLKNTKKSKGFYQKAIQYKTTFYGQQALEKLGFSPKDIKLEPLHFTSIQKKKFEQHSFVKIIHLLAKADLDQHILSFSYVLAKKLPSNIERQQVLSLIYDLAPNYAVTIAQAIASHQSVLHTEAYPTLKDYYDQHDKKVNMALVHAVIRKESGFVPKAISSANAQGLMQLLPETAKSLARKLDIPWSENLLTEQPLTNVRLGTFYLKRQLEKYNNSLPKTLASYNAGPGTLKKWLARFPDPDTKEIDVLDWIEILPYSETCNYIHRVLENYVIYTSVLHNS
ncbi:MAG: transglycosylase SLT domain-containing protein [Janthinobacterium lividum]